jgi:hypothetical protein
VKELFDAATRHDLLQAISGAAGALVFVVREGPRLGWKMRGVTVATGAVVAHYLTHPVIVVFNLSNIDPGGGTGFLLGLFGMSLAGAGLKLIRDIDWALVRGLFPGGKQ